MLRSLTIHVAQFGEPAMEFLLQKVLMVLTYVHRRGPASVPAQLQDLAHACFVALRAADTCEVTLQSLSVVMLSMYAQAKGFKDGREPHSDTWVWHAKAGSPQPASSLLGHVEQMPFVHNFV